MIKDSDLTDLAKLTTEASLSDLMAPGEVGMTLLRWANFYRTCTSFIYEEMILPFYAQDRRRVDENGSTLLHWAASLGQAKYVSQIIDNDGTTWRLLLKMVRPYSSSPASTAILNWRAYCYERSLNLRSFSAIWISRPRSTG